MYTGMQFTYREKTLYHVEELRDDVAYVKSSSVVKSLLGHGQNIATCHPRKYLVHLDLHFIIFSQHHTNSVSMLFRLPNTFATFELIRLFVSCNISNVDIVRCIIFIIKISKGKMCYDVFI